MLHRCGGIFHAGDPNITLQLVEDASTAAVAPFSYFCICQGGVDEGVVGVRDHPSPQWPEHHPDGVPDSAGAGARRGR